MNPGKLSAQKDNLIKRVGRKGADLTLEKDGGCKTKDGRSCRRQCTIVYTVASHDDVG